MQEGLNKSAEVLAYAKLDKKHGLVIPYRDGRGILRKYEPDFIIKTLEKMYLVETKAKKDMELSYTKLKAKAGINSSINQPQ